MVFSSPNQRYDIMNKCLLWFELVSQVSDVAHEPLVLIITALMAGILLKRRKTQDNQSIISLLMTCHEDFKKISFTLFILR